MISNLPALFTQTLQQIFGAENVLTDPAQCQNYNRDNSRQSGNAQVVVLANNAEQIQKLVKLCHSHKIPITVRGSGTGTVGGAVPITGGVVLSCEKMKKIIAVDPANRTMTVEPGVLNQEIQNAAAEQGFFWPPDPGNATYCTVGGNLAYNSAGPRAVKYGTPRENTLGLKVITGTGELIHTGTHTTKGVVGYDLTRLIIGSEGTLGIITEATLKLTPLPETKKTLSAYYRDIQSATVAVTKLMAQPIVPCALEFIDHTALELIKQHDVVIPDTAQALLIIEVDGLAAEINTAAEKLRQAANSPGLLEIKTAENAQQTEQLWVARKTLSLALRKIAPHKISEDVVVPVSCLPELITGLQAIAKQHQLVNVNFGHAGNGNIHANLLVDSTDPTQQENINACLQDMFKLVLQLNGTLSGEHGVGLEKRPYIDLEVDPVSIHLMRQIKKVFDPNNILNPGKIFEE